MTSQPVIVKAAYDPEAEVWYVEDSDLHGVNAWASTLEELRAKLPAVIRDLLDEAQGRRREGCAPGVKI